jgi:chromosomal replication initiation ATPase DnaA
MSKNDLFSDPAHSCPVLSYPVLSSLFCPLAHITLPYHILFYLSSRRKREVQLAVNLVTKLSNYSLAEKEAFTAKMQAECVELSGAAKIGNMEERSL